MGLHLKESVRIGGAGGRLDLRREIVRQRDDPDETLDLLSNFKELEEHNELWE